MRRKYNLKLLAGTVAGLLALSVCVHFLHGYQLQRNAYRLLERAEAEKNDDKALGYFEQYLSFVPNDVDAVQKYVVVLDRRAGDSDRVQVVLRMEQVLRAKPNEHDLRLRLVHNLIGLERYSEALDNLKKLQKTWDDKAEILHMIGWCQDARKDYAKAASAFEEAIRVNPRQVTSYALLAEVLQERLNQPDEAQKVIDDLVASNANTYQAYLIRARFERQRGDDKAAQSDLETAFKLAPDRPEVILELADAARARGDWVEATRLLQDGMKRFPAQTDFIKAIAGVKIMTDRRDEAIDFLKNGLRSAPKSAELAIMLTDLLIDQKRYDDAKVRIDELLKAGVKPTLPNYLKARLAVADRQWSEAIRLLENVRRDLGAGSDWSGRVNVLLGLSYREIGDHDQELQAIRRGVRDEPTWTAASVELGQALLNNGRLDEAGQALEPLRTAKDLPAGYWILLSRTRLNRQYRLPAADRSWETVDEALAQANPKDVHTVVMRAEALTARGDLAAAQSVLDKAGAEHPGDLALVCARADLAARQGKFSDAEKILGQGGDRLEIRLAQCRLWGGRGTSDDRAKLTRLGDIRETSYSLDQRTRLWRELADTWQRLGDLDRAEAILRELARDLPRDLRTRSALLDLAVHRNQPATARVWLAELRAIEGEQGWQWRCGECALLLQEARNRRGSAADVRKKLDELEKLHKNSPRVAVLAGDVSRFEGKHKEAIESYARALELGETQPGVLASLLGLLISRREFSRAETELAKYEQKQPLTPELARVGAEVALGMREKQYTRVAIRRAEQAVAVPPRDYRDALWLAHIYQNGGEIAKAESLLRASLDQAGHAPDTWIAWMEFCASTNRRDEAVKDLERLKKELAPARQPLTLARCYDALHLADEATRAYRDARNAAPDDLVTLSFAADFARRSERTNEARMLYERLLDPAVAAPVEHTVAARRRLATLLAATDPERAYALIEQNRAETVADQRVRFFILSVVPSDRKEAIRKFEESVRLQPLTPDERLMYADMLESAGKLGQARPLLADLIDESPATAMYFARYARLLIRMNELDDAGRQIGRLEKLEPSSNRTRELRAELTRALQKS